MVALLYVNKIKAAAPSGDFTEEVDEFKTASYSIRAAKGINNLTEKWNLQWVALTQAEATALKSLLASAAGMYSFSWQSPLATISQEWRVVSHKAEPTSDNWGLWNYTADLELSYTPSSTLMVSGVEDWASIATSATSAEDLGSV
jgi:phage-related protein